MAEEECTPFVTAEGMLFSVVVEEDLFCVHASLASSIDFFQIVGILAALSRGMTSATLHPSPPPSVSPIHQRYMTVNPRSRISILDCSVSSSSRR